MFIQGFSNRVSWLVWELSWKEKKSRFLFICTGATTRGSDVHLTIQKVFFYQSEIFITGKAEQIQRKDYEVAFNVLYSPMEG